MSKAEERGALGKRFHDLPTNTSDPNLSWEAMAANVLSPPPPEEEPEKRKPLIWWWLTAILLLLGATYYFTLESSTAEEPSAKEEILVAASDNDISSVKPISIPEERPIAGTSPQKNEQAFVSEFSTENASAVTNQPALNDGRQFGALQSNRPSPRMTNNILQEDRSDNLEIGPSTTAERTPLINDSRVPTTTKEVKAYNITSLLSARPTQLLSINHEVLLPVVKLSEILDNSSDKAQNLLSLTAGGFTQQSSYSGESIPETEASQSSPMFKLQFSKILGDKWQVSASIDGRQYRFRTAFEDLDENARLYRPGTVDTIFRNITTGEERVVLTDTIAGTRIRRFGNDNTVTELGLSLMIGRHWQFGRHGFLLSAGPRLGLVVGRDGRTTVQTNQVTDLASAPQYGKDLRISGRLEAGYRFNINQRWSIMAQLGAESSLSNWASGTTLTQRPTLLSGSLGIGVKW